MGRWPRQALLPRVSKEGNEGERQAGLAEGGASSFSGCRSQGSKAPINRLWPPRAWFWADEYRWTDGVDHSFIHQPQLLNCPKGFGPITLVLGMLRQEDCELGGQPGPSETESQKTGRGGAEPGAQPTAQTWSLGETLVSIPGPHEPAVGTCTICCPALRRWGQEDRESDRGV